MAWQIIVALVVAIPVILFPVALVWYINISGIYTAAKERKTLKEQVVKEEVII
jgi:hypothetical protein